MNRLTRTLIAIVAAVGLLFAGTAVAQQNPPGDQFLPYYTQEECEANGGLWAFDFCVDPSKVPVQVDDTTADTQAPATQAPATAAQTGPATQSQPQYTG